MAQTTRLPLDSVFYGASTFEELLKIVESITLVGDRQPVQFGVTKEKGVSIERSRKAANAAAISLLQDLPSDFNGAQLTPEQRATLAAYTGEGGIGGSEYEYYTPQHVAAGIWDMMKVMGAGAGSVLEPSAGAGVFHEEKPRGVLMTAAEISPVSGRINQLLHPEDAVNLMPFESLAVKTEDETFDHCVGNVPFADNRGDFGNLDPAYAHITNVGHYFILRQLDKIKAGGLACLIVPFGFTSGKNHAKFRAQVARKAEFLGAHRLPSGTFEENGTATAVDVWVLRKHPGALADTIMELSEKVLTETNVLWPVFLSGKWFDLDGRRFQYGETVMQGSGAFQRMTVKNDQITNQEMRTKLAHKFHSRIEWETLGTAEPDIKPMAEGDKRFINGIWYVMTGGRLVVDAQVSAQTIDADKYGAKSYGEIRDRLSSPQALIGLPFEQLQAINRDYPEAVPFEYRDLLAFAARQKPADQARVFRGAIIGQQIGVLQGKLYEGYSIDDLDIQRRELVALVNDELARGANPNMNGRVNITGGKAADWLRFKGSIHADGTLSDFLQGKLDTTGGKIFNSDNHEDCVRHLYNDVDRDPITIADLRAVFTGSLPEDDDEARHVLATIPGIALTVEGDLLPMDRATTGDIGLVSQALLGALPYVPEGAIKENYLRQLDEIRQKREWTNGEDIRFKLDSRWHDRRLVREFLHEQGFDQFEYVQSVEVEEGQVVSDLNYSGPDGVFIGYRYKTVNTTDKETGQIVAVYKEASGGDRFAKQLESYLNGNKPRGQNQNEYLEKIRGLEEDFNTWVRSHDTYDDLVQTYNDAFNKDIRYAHSDAALGLTGISGKRVPFGYQNEEIRRLSEDGRGILGFGTGLGKTTTGLALEAYNFEMGRTKRTAFVVPKSVLENWYHEATEFFSADALRGYLFVGLDELRDESGNIKRVPVLDEQGMPVMREGQPVMRNAVALSSSDTIKERMNMIPHSNYRAIVMTKEQYAAIPMRPETVQEHAQDVLYAAAAAGRVKLDGQSHREANAKNRLVSEASKTGSEKQQDFPYYEDMHFDSVIADEGHNYRNSYGAGREASALAYLPNSAVAKSARDMAVKNAYLMRKNNGRGAVLLTATPLVNSPIDAFNMLSHIIPATEWQRMGIHTPDDFVKMFGKTEQVYVTKIDGSTEAKQGLVGFQNLKALRGIFNRWTTMKGPKDVSSEVKIPDLDEKNVMVPMTAEQQTKYEELRMRASLMSNPNMMAFDAKGNPILMTTGTGEVIDPTQDSVFSIIRDMDRLCTDPDLYHRTMTFRFPVAKMGDVQQLADALPKALNIKGDSTEDEENASSTLEYHLQAKDKYCELVVPELYESEVMARLKSFNLSDSEISHPIPPKYSALIENLKTGMQDGKQIIFSDEKSQHGKLRRIIAQALGIDAAEIGILNATTVADAAKGKKLKAVKKPDEPGEDASPEKLADYYQKMQAYEDYVGALNDVRLGGLESIAADYNEGRTRIIICNKKAEVGINLHKGTADIHHLTLPWTPASINQRNGRGARVGSTNDTVRAHYYCGKGSFDEFRLATLKRKGNWINEVMTSDAAEMENADANNADELKQFLAADDGEREQQRQAQINQIKAKARIKAINAAKVSLQVYIKAKHAANTSVADIQERMDQLNADLDEANTELATALDELNILKAAQLKAMQQYEQELEEQKSGNQVSNFWLNSRKQDRTQATTNLKNQNIKIGELRARIGAIQTQQARQNRVLTRIEKAEKEIKRFRPEVERAIRDGYLEADMDLVDHADQYYIDQNTGKRWRAGRVYEFTRLDRLVYVKVDKLDIDTGEAIYHEIFSSRPDYPARNKPAGTHVKNLGNEVSFTPNELSLRQAVQGGMSIENIALTMGRESFHSMLKQGWLALSDQYVVHRTSDGKLTAEKLERHAFGDTNKLAESAFEWLKNNADVIVYPDTADEQLKTAVAAWIRNNSFWSRSVSPFLRALFGGNFMTAMDSYGEQASPDMVREACATKLSERLTQGSNESGNIDGTAPGMLFNAFTKQNYSTSLWVTRMGGGVKELYKDYANRRDFDDEWQAQIIAMSGSIDRKVFTKRQAVAQGIVEEVKALVAGNHADAIARIQANSTAQKNVMRFELDYYLTPNPTIVEELNLAQMFSDAVIGNLCNLSDITINMLENPLLREDLQREINAAWRQSRVNMTEWVNDMKLAAGLITQDQIDEANIKQAELASQRTASQTVNGAVTIKSNASAIRGGKSTNKYDYAPGECWCLNDARENGGALRDAKDELKSSFGAKYYKNNRDSSAELVGSWWLVDAQRATMEELAAVVAKYES
ncbi:TPA: DEAD/DEAH box helicase family protein [Enterobacter hormaechei subsp. xiangfangensis]|nr:DEAD/DEAH box helicase family protein [Enterobacter hormaechei subsp. xiangfangensis]